MIYSSSVNKNKYFFVLTHLINASFLLVSIKYVYFEIAKLIIKRI